MLLLGDDLGSEVTGEQLGVRLGPLIEVAVVATGDRIPVFIAAARGPNRPRLGGPRSWTGRGRCLRHGVALRCGDSLGLGHCRFAVRLGAGADGHPARRGARIDHRHDAEVRAEHDHDGLAQHVLAAAAGEAVPRTGIGHGQ